MRPLVRCGETPGTFVVRYSKDTDRVGFIKHQPGRVDLSQLEQQCRNLEEELDQVKHQIVKIVTDKNDFNKENAILRSYQAAFATLTEQNELLKTALSEHSKMLDISVIVDSPEADRTSPDGQEIDGDQMTFKSSVEYEAELQNIRERNKALEDENKLVTSKLDKWKELEETNGQLEESLELMRQEFESMEDYWQGKLDQERKFYDEQLKFSDCQQKDLEVKLKEYDEILLNSRNAHLSISEEEEEDDKLSTIEETFSLECQVSQSVRQLVSSVVRVIQVTEWEEEIAKLKEIIEERDVSHRAETDRLEQDWRRKLRQEEQRGERRERGGETLSAGVWAGTSQSFSPHSVVLSQGPQSLPSELVSEAHREVRRLQELRRYIQEECDQLLLRKERLKEEVVWHAEHNYASLDGHLMSHKSLIFPPHKRGVGLQHPSPGSQPGQEVCMTVNRETSL